MTQLLRAAVICGVIVAGAWLVIAEDQPKIPKSISVPAGHVPLFTVQAKGVQIYKSAEGKDGKLEWVLEAPLAELTSGKGEPFGCHFAGPPNGGPAWEAVDGSRLVRDKAEEVKSAPAPQPGSDIPWLLVRVKADDGKPGTLSKVTYVQRIQTEGGKPPADAPRRADTRIGVPYKATYVFHAPAK